MRIKGSCKIYSTDLQGNITNEVIKENLIPDDIWLLALGSDATPNLFNRSISISTDTSTPIATTSVVNNVIATAYRPNDVASPVFIENIDPPYGIIKGRIDFIGTTRTFNSVALTALGASNNQFIGSTTAYARPLLDIPYTQLEFEFLNLEYTIQFIDDIGEGFIDKKLARYDFARTCFSNQTQFRMGLLSISFCSKNNCNSLPFSNINIGDSFAGGSTNAWTSMSRVNSLFKWKYRSVRSRDIFQGYIINSLIQGQSSDGIRTYSISKFNYPTEPFQTGFLHGSNSIIPFFDASNPASSRGKVILSGSWNKKIPELYRINFISTGASGTATYKFSILKHLGFNGNTYNHLDGKTIYRVPDIKFVTKLHGWRVEDFDVHRLSESEVVQYDTDGVSIVDVIDGTNTTYDVTTTPQLPATNIRQIAVDETNRLVYVACRVTGLWLINLPANTVTNIFTQACYGVDIGRNNIAIAIIEGGLYRSTDWNTAAIFNFTGISSQWSRVRFLKADPEDINDQIAIVADNGSNVNRVVWHQFSNNVSTLGYENASIRSYPASLDVSDTGSHWVVFRSNGTNKLIYGTNNLDTGYSSFARNINHSIWGNQSFSKITFYGNNYIGISSLQGGSNSASYGKFNYAGTSNTSFILHLSGGVILADQSWENIFGLPFSVTGFMIQLFPAIAQINYGWNGSEWVINHSGSKTTHATNQPLINGLQIRFEDGSTTPHFLQNEYYTQGINYGILKDNATDFEINTAWYSKPIYTGTVNTTITATSLTLPAVTDQYFRTIENDDEALHNLSIAGVKVSKIWFDNTVPAATEIRLQANGTVIFNSADIGKSFTGSYIWVSV